MMRTLSGPIRTQDFGGGLWQLTAAASDAVRLYLRVPVGANCAALQDRDIRRLDLEWHRDGITVQVTGANGIGRFEAGTAIIHESQSRLYEGLPLAPFDAKARQFWQRVFLLMRIPGGRYLLRMIARRRR